MAATEMSLEDMDQNRHSRQLTEDEFHRQRAAQRDSDLQDALDAANRRQNARDIEKAQAQAEAARIRAGGDPLPEPDEDWSVIS